MLPFRSSILLHFILESKAHLELIFVNDVTCKNFPFSSTNFKMFMFVCVFKCALSLALCAVFV